MSNTSKADPVYGLIRARVLAALSKAEARHSELCQEYWKLRDADLDPGRRGEIWNEMRALWAPYRGFVGICDSCGGVQVPGVFSGTSGLGCVDCGKTFKTLAQLEGAAAR